MKRTRGFTLIELLAVIVILAIIALIAVPVITNIIEYARREAFRDSAYGIIEAGNLYFTENLLSTTNSTETRMFSIQQGKIMSDNIELLVKGEVPTSGNVLVTNEGKVAIAISDGKYCAKKMLDEHAVTINKDIENCNLNYNNENTDESDFQRICSLISDADNSNTVTSGDEYICTVKKEENLSYTFYVLETPSESATKIKLIMDSNLGNSHWIDRTTFIAAGGTAEDYDQNYNYRIKGPRKAIEVLENLTNDWDNIPSFDYTYQDKSVCVGGWCYGGIYDDIIRTGIKARLVEYSEISDYCETNTSSVNRQVYAGWLLANLSQSNTNLFGYWVSNSGPRFNEATSVGVEQNGVSYLNANSVSVSGYGVRPVIELSI